MKRIPKFMLGLFIVLICLQPVFCGGQKESAASVSSGPVQVDDMLWAVGLSS